MSQTVEELKQKVSAAERRVSALQGKREELARQRAEQVAALRTALELEDGDTRTEDEILELAESRATELEAEARRLRDEAQEKLNAADQEITRIESQLRGEQPAVGGLP